MNRTRHNRPYYHHLLPLLAGMLCCARLVSQTDTAARALGEVVIQSDKLRQFGSGKKTQALDSATLALYNSSSLAEVLAAQSSIHIKSYGNGNIATTSFRGGNAGQTALVWNGINIQNNMLGQNDLSLVNTALFDNISLEYGGSSALWGSGAMGGAIHLNNKPLFGRCIRTKLASTYGSFNTRKLSTAIDLGYKKWASGTKVYYTSSDNNYPYKDTADKQDPNKCLSHSNYMFKGFMQDLSVLLGNAHKISIRGWYNEASRNLPSYTGVVSKQSQLDRNLKLNAEWACQKRRYSTYVRGAYLYDALNYTDSLAAIFSKSHIQTIIAENEHIYRHRNHLFNAGLNYTRYAAQTQDYAGMHQVNKLALFLSYKWQGFGDRLSVSASARQEFSDQLRIPLTGNAGITGVLSRRISLKASAARSFRQPTLNDLYWNPGGNPGLKPEEALGFEGGLVYNKTIGDISIYAEGTYFNRHTTNWIIWLPQNNGTWSPHNIAKVYSRGTETNFRVNYTSGHTTLRLFGSTAYVLSTNEQVLNENDNSKDRQLIYTPRYTLQGGVLLAFQQMSLLYSQSYTGYRFTSTDNSTWLPPYNIASLRASYSLSVSKVILQASIAFNNLYNASYHVVAGRPMPMRSYEAGITLLYNNKNKINQ